MSDDYLWDKSGEPDPEIERLEGLLTELRYRRPAHQLPLPQRAPVLPRRLFRPAYAVAATVLLMALASGLWLNIGARKQSATQGIAAVSARTGSASEWLNFDSLSLAAAPGTDEETSKPRPVIITTGGSRAGLRRRSPGSSPELRRREMPFDQTANSFANGRAPASDEEGLAAREQLIKALHLASSKLNLLQKKVQDNKSGGPTS
jgi:hypothetical protein